MRPEEANDSMPTDPPVEEQLAQYASDLQELFRAHRGLQRSATETRRLFDRRSHEVSALNDFMRRRLADLFEVEAEYEAALDRLQALAPEIDPPHARQAVESLVSGGRAFLERRREEEA